jgi:hypothetical protein
MQQRFGRPRALDEDLCAEICNLVSAGHSVPAVARIVGRDVRTIRRHAQRDDNFARLLGVAEVSARNDPLKMVRRAASGSWRAAAWLLERTDPERYAKQAPATCRPQDVDKTFTRIMETVLREIPNEPARRSMYHNLAKVMEEETVRLFLPPAARIPSQKLHDTRCVDEQRLNDFVDSLSTPAVSPREAAGTPQGGTFCGNSSPINAKSPPSISSTNPGENHDPRL